MKCCDVTSATVLICRIDREEDATDKAEKKETLKDKKEEKMEIADDDSGSDKEIVKEWKTRSRGLEKGTVIFLFECLLSEFLS